MKIKHALLTLTAMVAFASCTTKQANSGNQNTTPDYDEVNYRVTALTHQGDTLWHVVSERPLTIYTDETRVIEKETGLEYRATAEIGVSSVPFYPNR